MRLGNDRIKRKSVLNKLEEGGLNMIDLKTQICAIKAAWTSQIITAPYDHLWPNLLSFTFQNSEMITILLNQMLSVSVYFMD